MKYFSKAKPSVKSNGFTLVELIVVITILAILGTIGFISIQGYSSSARDSTRISDVATIGKAIEITLVERGTAPIPFGAVSYTGGTVTLQVGTAASSAIPKLSAGVADPLTKKPYAYSVFGDGLYYQLGSNYENAISFNTGIPGIETVYADTATQTSKLTGNYAFDPSLPSLFPIAGTINSASGGIFSPDGCFVLNNVATNSFDSTAANCIPKRSLSLKSNDTSLVGYGDMETLTGALLRDMSGNGNDGTFSGGMTYSGALTGGLVGKGLGFTNNSTGCIYIVDNAPTLTGSSFTIETIVKIISLDTADLNYIFGGYGNGAFFLRINADGRPNVGFSINGWREVRNGQSFPTLNDNKYHHLVGQLDNASQKVKLYMDGVFLGENTMAGSMIPSNMYYISTTPWRPGLNGITNSIIDDVKIYNRVLNDTEIKQHAKIAGF